MAKIKKLKKAPKRLKNGPVRVTKPEPKRTPAVAAERAVTKAPVNIRLDLDVIDFFRRQYSPYQTKINAILRDFMEDHR